MNKARGRHKPSKVQLKTLHRMTNGWRVSSVPRSLRVFDALHPYRSEKLGENNFKALRDAGWIELDLAPFQWRISPAGRKAIGMPAVPLCH